jgi:hypothetical protein
MDTLLNTLRDLTYLHDWRNYLREGNNIYGDNGVKQQVINAIEAVVSNGGITTGRPAMTQEFNALPMTNVADKRLCESIGFLSYLYNRNNYSRGNIVEVQQKLIHAIEDMVSFNSAQARGITFERIMGLRQRTMAPPLTMNAPTPRPTLVSEVMVVSQEKVEEDCPDDCAICQETPKYKDAVCTDCNHYYCKNCWDVWMNALISNHTCPTCRKVAPKTTTFRATCKARDVIDLTL